jgi:hypothetical protein
MTDLLRKAIAEIEKLPQEKQDEIASLLLAELSQENEELLLEQLAKTPAVVFSPYDAHEAAQSLSELLAAAQKENNP